MGEIAKTYASTFLYNKGSYEKHLVDFLMTSKEIDKDSESFKDIRFDVKRRQIDNCLYKILDSKNVKLMISYAGLIDTVYPFCCKVATAVSDADVRVPTHEIVLLNSEDG